MLEKLKPILKEPLVHFSAVGLLLFVIFGGNNFDPASRVIHVNEAKITQLAENFTRTWQREPTKNEIDSLIRDYIREEIYYREAKTLNLDENDTIIRRRLRSKMESLAVSQAQSATPTQAALQKLLDKNPDKYASGTLYSFQQIWLGEDSDAKSALTKLESGADPKAVGAKISLPANMQKADKARIDRAFGAGFTGQLASLADNKWSGPVESGFGKHLVQISSRIAGKKPEVADIKQTLENDWRAQNVSMRKEEAYQALLDTYDIELEKPE